MLLETLAFGLVEIERASDRFTAGGKQYQSGSYIIRMQQPFSSFAKTLLERQNYPDLRLYPGGPPRRPYDVTAHTLPLLMGVAVDTVEQPFQVASRRAETFTGLIRNQLCFELRTPTPGAFSTKHGPAGKVSFATGQLETFTLVNQPSPTCGHCASQDRSVSRVGFLAWTKAGHVGSLKSSASRSLRFVIGTCKRVTFARSSTCLCFPIRKLRRFTRDTVRARCRRNSREDSGTAGAEALKQFAHEGGTIVFLNDSTAYAMDHLGANVKDVLAGVSNREFYAPGSLLKARLESHPLTLGLPQRNRDLVREQTRVSGQSRFSRSPHRALS